MSVLHIGSQCAICPLVDFLPTTCPDCSFTFCRDHISAHQCASTVYCAELSSAGPSTFNRKAICELSSCQRPSIEAIGGYDGDSSEAIARKVRCVGCSGSFCTVHRRQDDHNCPAARDYTVRSDAADARKVKAADTLSKHFPSHPAKEIAKPTAHTRDLKRPHSSASSLAPDLRHPPNGPAAVIPSSPVIALSGTVGAEGSGEKTTKSKQAKLFDLHLRKLRIGARPLDSRQRPDLPRRFFEIKHGVTESDTVTGWQEGKALPGLEKVWMHEITPIGKVLDILLEKNKIPRPVVGDTDAVLSLLCLNAGPDNPRKIAPLDLSRPCVSIPEGSTVVLVRGWKA